LQIPTQLKVDYFYIYPLLLYIFYSDMAEHMNQLFKI